MDPEKLLEAITGIVGELRADMVKHAEKCDAAVADAVKKMDAAGARRKQADEDDVDPTGATRTAADSRADAMQGSLRVLQDQVNQMVVERGKSHDRQNQSTRDAYAEAQSKADTAMRTNNNPQSRQCLART